MKVKLFTVPGQVIHNATRRIVLQSADAVAFIADSRRSAGADNNAYWKNLHENMRENGLDPAQVPLVIQFNKRDLPDTKTRRGDRGDAGRGKEPIIGAVAMRGEGVLETLHAVLQVAYRYIDERADLAKNIGLTEREFLTQIFGRIDTAGTHLEKTGSRSCRSDEDERRSAAHGRRRRCCSGACRWRRCSTCRLHRAGEGLRRALRVGIKVFDEQGRARRHQDRQRRLLRLRLLLPRGPPRCTATVARVKEGPMAPRTERARR